MSGDRADGRGLWWVSPAGVVLLVVPLSLVLAVATSDAGFRLLYRTPKVLTTEQALLFLAAGGALLLGVLLASAGRAERADPSSGWPGLQPHQLRVVSRASDVCFWLTVVGYVAYLAAGVSRGLSFGRLRQVLATQSNYTGELREVFAPVTGVTTLTQVGIAYVVLAGVLLISGHRRRVLRRVAIVVVLSLLRAFFLTERLAVIEVLVPLTVLLALGLRQGRGRARWLPAAPAVALPLLVVVFGIFEYSRSWVFFRTRTTATFPEFVLDRLAGYYATAYNNGAIQLVHTPDDGRLPYATVEALWTAPGVQQLDLYTRFTGLDPGAEYGLLLAQHGTPEFNNPGGLAVPLAELGVVGGLLAFLVAGLLVGAAYASFRRGSALGLLLYPLVYTGLLELPRYLYWTQGRVVPPVLALVVVAVLLRRARPPSAPEPTGPLPALAGAAP